MEYKELKKKSAGDLHRILAEKRDELRELRFKDANKQLKDVRAIRRIRTAIARTLTLLNSQGDNKGKEKDAETKQASN